MTPCPRSRYSQRMHLRPFLILAAVVTLAAPVHAQDAPTPAAADSGAAFSAEGTDAAPAPDASGAAPVQTGAPDPERPWNLPVQPDAKIKIGKIYEFLNDPTVTKTGASRSLAYEFKYFDHGAVTKGQREARKGRYFVVTWSNSGPAEDLVLRLDFRQMVSRDRVKTIEIPFKQARGTYKGTFSVTGDAYTELGDVHSWRISVVRGGQIVAEERSFIW